MRHRSFAELRAHVEAQPGAREEIDAHKRAMRDAMKLAELRSSIDNGQQQQATATPDESHPSISSIEHEEDVYLSALRSYVEALGGELQLNAVFPDAIVTIVAAPSGSIQEEEPTGALK